MRRILISGGGYQCVDCVADGRAMARQAARIVPVQLQ